MKSLLSLIALAALPLISSATVLTDPASVQVSGSGTTISLSKGSYEISASGSAYNQGSQWEPVTYSEDFDMKIGDGKIIEYTPNSTNKDKFVITVDQPWECIQLSLTDCRPLGSIKLSIDPISNASAAPEPASIGLMELVLVGGVAISRKFRKA